MCVCVCVCVCVSVCLSVCLFACVNLCANGGGGGGGGGVQENTVKSGITIILIIKCSIHTSLPSFPHRRHSICDVIENRSHLPPLR